MEKIEKLVEEIEKLTVIELADLVKAIITKNDSVIIDKNINKQLLAGQSPNIIVLEFKIIPVTDINAAIPINYNPIDPFIYTEDCN